MNRIVEAKIVTKYVLSILPKQHCSNCWHDEDGIKIVGDSLESLWEQAAERLPRNHIFGFPLSRQELWETEYIEFEDVSLNTEREEKEWTQDATKKWLTDLFSSDKFIDEMERVKDAELKRKLAAQKQAEEDQEKRERETYYKLKAKYDEPPYPVPSPLPDDYHLPGSDF